MYRGPLPGSRKRREARVKARFSSFGDSRVSFRRGSGAFVLCVPIFIVSRQFFELAPFSGESVFASQKRDSPLLALSSALTPLRSLAAKRTTNPRRLVLSPLLAGVSVSTGAVKRKRRRL